uniref:Uncharacterized protein n=1 Tax=Anguilla anguilla TaxID=7936 RepID=A0A0E9UDC1_ANGAN
MQGLTGLRCSFTQFSSAFTNES